METPEHIEVGEAIQYKSIIENPYLNIRKKGDRDVLHVSMMHNNHDIPVPIANLEMSSGEVIAMAGDYFSKPGWADALDISHEGERADHITRGKRIIADPIHHKEYSAFKNTYNTLANLNGRAIRYQIDLIKIICNFHLWGSGTFSLISKLSHWLQNLMLAISIPNYKEMLENNEAHFTPWSVRAYVISHSISLKYARIAWDLRLCSEDEHREAMKGSTLKLIKKVETNNTELGLCDSLSRKEALLELSHRFHAMSVGTELYGMHYFSDGFAAGHMSRMGFLRTVLPEKFGSIGSILVNAMHNEDNEIGITVDDHYDPDEIDDDIPVVAQGDGLVDSHLNKENRKNCIIGMCKSIDDIETVLNTGQFIETNHFGGFQKLPDIDLSISQPQPMFVLWRDKVYYRDPINTVQMMGPTAHVKLLRHNPSSYGYRHLEEAPVSNSWFGRLFDWKGTPTALRLALATQLKSANVVPLQSKEKSNQQIQEKQAQESCRAYKDGTRYDLELFKQWRNQTEIREDTSYTAKASNTYSFFSKRCGLYSDGQVDRQETELDIIRARSKHALRIA